MHESKAYGMRAPRVCIPPQCLPHAPEAAVQVIASLNRVLIAAFDADSLIAAAYGSFEEVTKEVLTCPAAVLQCCATYQQ